jgi:hypothetical protein
MHRLTQYYLVEQLSRALDFKLQWHKKNRGYIFGERSLYSSSALDDANEHNDYNGPENFGEEGLEDNDNSDGKKKKSTFLASSFNGSPRHLNDLAHNALTIVTELGKPDLFITMTCNPHWEEIKQNKEWCASSGLSLSFPPISRATVSSAILRLKKQAA